MKLTKNGWRALTALALCAAGAALAQPAQAQNVVGVVDEDKLADKYTVYKQILEGIDKKAKALDGQLEARELLSPEEGKRFDELIAKSPRLAAEEGELAKLIATGTDRRAAYLALIAKSNRTADEETKIKLFLGYSKANDAPLKIISDKLFGKVRDEQDAAEKKYTDQANTVIGEVAKKKGLKVVCRKRALVWNDDAVDITDDVLATLNKP